MAFDNELVGNSLRRWEQYLNNYNLPKWDDIPNFGLYMEQVLILLGQYLDYLPPELKKEQFLTASAINNYVRKKYMPGPNNKKYYRVHIAYLIIICSLKQSISITTLASFLPNSAKEEDVKRAYDAYVARHKVVVKYFIGQVRKISSGILGREMKEEIETDSSVELIVSSAIISGFSGLLAEKLLLLYEKENKREEADAVEKAKNEKENNP